MIEILRIDDRFTRHSELLALIQAAFAFMDGVIDPPSSAHRLTVESLAQKACDEIGLIATDSEADAALIGCAFLRPEPDALYIGKLAIAPQAQGRGIGRALLSQTEAIARENGLRRLRLETRIELVRNHQVFSAWGFARTAENSHAGYDRITSVEMTKTLG